MTTPLVKSPQLSAEFIESYADFQVPWGPMGYVVFRRTYSRPVVPEWLSGKPYHEQLQLWKEHTGDSKAFFRTEEWYETTARCVNWYLEQANGAVSIEEGEELFDAVMNLKCSFSGRGMWQYGTETVKKLGQNSICNCYHVTVDSTDAFLFAFDMLMLGGGVGFNMQKEHVYEIPKVIGATIINQETRDANFIVPDSREGWVDALRHVFSAYFVTGENFSYSTVLVRSAGEPISSFGGNSSGPIPLREGISNICAVLDSRIGKKLRPVDVLDLMCIIGAIVVSGNVRRSSLIGVGDHEDTHFLQAKRFDLKDTVPNWRAMSNNTVVCNDIDHLPDKFWKTYEVGGEPIGLFNLKLSREKGRTKDTHRSDASVDGLNPCLSGSTLVAVADGRDSVSIQELASTGKDVLVYSLNKETRQFEVKWGRNPRVTGRNQELVRVYFKTGHVDVTLNHKFLLNDGRTVEAKDLREGDSLPKFHRLKDTSVEGDNHSDNLNVSPLTEFFDSHGESDKVEGLTVWWDNKNNKMVDRVCETCSSTYGIPWSKRETAFCSVECNPNPEGGAEIRKAGDPRYESQATYRLKLTEGAVKDQQDQIMVYGDEEDDEPNSGSTKVRKLELLLGKHTVYNITVDDNHTVTTLYRADEKSMTGVASLQCGEIALESGESCNLAEVFLPNIVDEEELLRVTELIWKVTKVVTTIPHNWEMSDKVIKKNRRTGLGVTGVCEVLKKPFDDLFVSLSNAYENLEKVDVAFSEELTKVLGEPIGPSVKLTTLKPSGCRPAEAMTVTDKGILTLYELHENHEEGKDWCDVDGVKVIRPGGEYAISKTYNNGEAEVFQVNMAYGATVRSTGNHKWFVNKRRFREGDRWEYDEINKWVCVDEIQVGDILEYTQGLYTSTISSDLAKINMHAFGMRYDATRIIQPEKMNVDLAWLLGYFWGDGVQSPACFQIRFSDGNQCNIDKVLRIVEKQFGISRAVDISKGRDYFSLTFASVELWHWFIGQGFWKYYDLNFEDKSCGKSLSDLPKVLRTSSKEDILAFLSGYTDANGCVSRDNNNSARCSLSTSDQRWARHLQSVMQSVGITLGCSYNESEGSHKSSTDTYLMNLSIPISSEESLRAMMRHSNKWDKLFKNHPDVDLPTEVFQQPGVVIDVESVGVQRTFDFEVPDGHCFYEGGFKSHNSLSLLPGCTPGVHPAYSQYYIRRMRVDANSPIIAAARASNYQVEQVLRYDGTSDVKTSIIAFPVKVPKGTPLADDMSAIEQLELVANLQEHYSDNAVSCTVYLKPGELPDVKDWLLANYKERIKSVSFLLHSDHGFVQAPYEEIDEATYEKMASKLAPLDLTGSHDEMYDADSCAGGACPVR